MARQHPYYQQFATAAKARRAREQGEAEAERRTFRRLMSEAEEVMEAELEERAAWEKLTPEERRLRALEQQQKPVRDFVPGNYTPRPVGWYNARAAVQAKWDEEAAERRRKRECKAGMPAKQEAWDKRVQEIKDARDAGMRVAQERCRADEQSARDRAEAQLAELGERPVFVSPEAVAA